ncbi:uncharacterized protein LOC143231038 isoform X2 [Tachypleus tridentatus]|uniref:uncharacterized protein LOC143231038 isoform X2 n=1 Tax=Tachypleus tridentatus TaxID=6853 RepID=UPI003FD56CC4
MSSYSLLRTIVLYLMQVCYQYSENQEPQRIINTSEVLKHQVDTLFLDFWDWRLRESPEFATYLGNHTFDDRLDSYSLQSFQKRKMDAVNFLQKAQNLTLLVQEESTRLNLKVFISDLKTYVEGMDEQGYFYPINSLEGVQLNLKSLVGSMQFQTVDDFWMLISRYRAVKQKVEEIIELLKEAIRQGRTNHAISMKRVPEQFDLIQKEVEHSPFYEPFLSFPEWISLPDKKILKTEGKKVIEREVLPSLKKLGSFIKNEYMTATRPHTGISSLPDGKRFYQQCLRFHTSTDMTPEEIHQLGLQEVKRISREIDMVIKSLGSNLSRSDFLEQLRNDPQFFFKTKQELLLAYKDTVENQIEPKIEQVIKKAPNTKLLIVPFPLSSTETIAAFYVPSSPDGSRLGKFYLNTANPKRSPIYKMMSLSLHEGIPGHHLQGWGLYSEFLGNELNLFKDPYFRLGHLSEEIFRACRLVVDTGIHAFGWTREKAINYMLRNSASTKRNVEGEIDRYITWPGQACAYKIGQLKIIELRKKAELRLGNNFDIREFHDVILQSQGPLSFLEERVDDFIEKYMRK